MKSFILHIIIYIIFAMIYGFIIQIIVKSFPIFKWEGLDVIMGVLTCSIICHNLKQTADKLITKLNSHEK